jgi:hypothetical protein
MVSVDAPAIRQHRKQGLDARRQFFVGLVQFKSGPPQLVCDGKLCGAHVAACRFHDATVHAPADSQQCVVVHDLGFPIRVKVLITFSHTVGLQHCSGQMDLPHDKNCSSTHCR